VKHLQVPQTKPNNKNTKKSSSVNNAEVNYSGDDFNDSKSTDFQEFLNADKEVKLIRPAGKLFQKLVTRSEKKLHLAEQLLKCLYSL